MVCISKLTAAALLLALVMLAQPAQAQFRGFPPSLRSMMMLRMDPVQKELDLKKEQNEELGKLAAAAQSEFLEIYSGLQDLSDEEKKEELPNLMKTLETKGKEMQGKVDKILNDKQKARLRQLSLQQRGAEALNDEDVIKELKLSDEQKKNLTAVREEAEKRMEEAMKALFSGGGGGDQAEMRTKMAEMRKELSDKAFAVLTSEQRDQFEKMKGDKFNFPQGRSGLPF